MTLEEAEDIRIRLTYRKITKDYLSVSEEDELSKAQTIVESSHEPLESEELGLK